MPGYAIRYAGHVTADSSVPPVSLPGQRFLVVVLRPAQAHLASGASTIGRAVHRLGFPMLAGWVLSGRVLSGDSEGVISLALGLNASAAIRVGELRGRLYIDVRY